MLVMSDGRAIVSGIAAVLCGSAQTNRHPVPMFDHGSFCDSSKIAPMNSVRLYVDGADHWRAIIGCNICIDVDEYPALDALDAPIKRKCGQRADVRDALLDEISKHREAPLELRKLLNPLGRLDEAAA